MGVSGLSGSPPPLLARIVAYKAVILPPVASELFPLGTLTSHLVLLCPH